MQQYGLKHNPNISHLSYEYQDHHEEDFCYTCITAGVDERAANCLYVRLIVNGNDERSTTILHDGLLGFLSLFQIRVEATRGENLRMCRNDKADNYYFHREQPFVKSNNDATQLVILSVFGSTTASRIFLGMSLFTLG